MYDIVSSQATTFQCPACNNWLLELTPFCGHCRQPMPLESDLRKQGRIDPDRREIRNVSEVSEINRQLELFRGYAAKFWFFSVSHCMLEIHLYRTGGHKAILLCAGTDLIRCSSHTWKCDLAVIPIPNPRGYEDNYYCEFFAVRDLAADVEFTCSIPVLYLGFDSPFSGDGLCPL